MKLLSHGLLLLLLGACSVRAETIVEKRISSTRRFLPLKKLTVGPDDQYHGVVDASGHLLVFTHKSDLVSHLKIQDLVSGDSSDLLSLTADSQEPAISPAGKVAFVYYKYNARGDICTVDLPVKVGRAIEDSQISCLHRNASENDTERGGPFWKSNDEIGFVIRDIQNKIWKIVAQNIRTGELNVLGTGKLWSPSMKPGGRYLVYDQIVEKDGTAKRNLVLQDLVTSEKHILHFSLPGISGFPSVSEDEKYLYFSHYLNDTNQDNVIDGSDNAVIFRVPIQKILATKDSEAIFPEQLSSVESSCSFPRTQGEDLYVTCAFEGNLDVYRLPSSGMVPSDWNKPILENALQTSRSYPDRILVLNTMKYRLNDESLTEKLLSNHVLSDDTAAARYYLGQLKSKPFYRLLDLYLRIRELKKSQPSDEVTREFQLKMAGLEAELGKIQDDPNFKRIILGFIRAYLGQPKAAASEIKQVHFTGNATPPLERYLNFELVNRVNPNLEAYRSMMIAPELSEESKIYYAFNALVFIEAHAKNNSDRLETLEKLNHGMPKPVEALLSSEISVLQLIQAPTPAEKAKHYRDLDKLMSDSRNDYFLRKASYVRAILNFSAASEFQYLSNVATNWLRYTTNGDTEFIYAREVFSNSALDQAYDNFGKKNYNFAGNFFYESISLTDDLESHYGYIKTMLLKNQRKTIDDRYANLKQRQFIEDNMKFVEALLNLVDQSSNAKSLDLAIQKLMDMQQDRDSPVRYLLLGYCHLHQLIDQPSGQDFNQETFETAHRELMLAYDLGRENDRIKAAALMNLGILHQRAQNFALSARFFGLRKKMGFVSPDEQAQYEWLYARTLFLNRDAAAAVGEISQVPSALMSAPFLERKAFYEMNAGQYEISKADFESLLNHGQMIGNLNLAKAYLSLGYNQFKLKDAEGAKKSWLSAISFTDAISPRPNAIQLILYGLLAQVTSGEEKIKNLEKRAELLKGAKNNLDEWLPTVIQNQLQLADAIATARPSPEVASHLEEALKLMLAYADQNQYFGTVVYQTLKDYLVYGVWHPKSFEKEDASTLKRAIEKTAQTYDGQNFAQAPLQFQNLKLKILWALYQQKVLHLSGKASVQIESLVNSDTAKQVKESLPKQWEEIERLRKVQ